MHRRQRQRHGNTFISRELPLWRMAVETPQKGNPIEVENAAIARDNMLHSIREKHLHTEATRLQSYARSNDPRRRD
jgi:hypothetical protein